MNDRLSVNNNHRENVQHYVVKKNTIAHRFSGDCSSNISQLKSGTLVLAPEKDKQGRLKIRVVDSVTQPRMWENTEWMCAVIDLIPVSPFIWQLLLAVPDYDVRTTLANSTQLHKDIQKIQLNSEVLYCPDTNPLQTYWARVKFIGPVPELGDGFYFGLDLLEKQEIQDFSYLPEEYFTCITSNGLFTNLSNIKLRKPIVNQDPDNNFEKSEAVEKNLVRLNVEEELNIGSHVKVFAHNNEYFGLVQWIEKEVSTGNIMAVIGLDYKLLQGEMIRIPSYDDGRYFHCRYPRMFFRSIKKCIPSKPRMTDNQNLHESDDQFGNAESPVIEGIVSPMCVKSDLESICGKKRGIQGHHNSCYLDATIFSMFMFTSVLDSLLYRPPNEKDCSQYTHVQRVLREEIVNPLRKNAYVSANHVMKLRTLLEKLSSVSGLTSEEKDPEEFLTSLVAQTLNTEPFLKLSSGQEAYHYQLFVEKDEQLTLPTVQQLIEQSFFASNIRLKEVPSCLIIQMPRFGKSFKMYPKIQPTLLLDITHIIEDSPRHCTVCGESAEFTCNDCYGQRGSGIESTSFCAICLKKVHCHESRVKHIPQRINIPLEYQVVQKHSTVPHLYLELSAVLCIETSHYVTFVKCGSGAETPWCFFDSMADRKGEQNGYNIPEMVPCPDFHYWLSEEGATRLASVTDDRDLPEHAKRLLCDAYMCMYQSPDVMMYK